jgi:hypothetical protein
MLMFTFFLALSSSCQFFAIVIHQSLATVVAGVAFAAHGGCILCGRRGIWCMSRGKSISASSSIIVIASISWFLFLLLNFLLLTSPF